MKEQDHSEHLHTLHTYSPYIIIMTEMHIIV